MMAILPWWGIPVAVVLLTVAVLSVVRRLRQPHNDLDEIDTYRRFRESLRHDDPRP